MPTKTREYSLFAPGCLVQSVSDIYSATPIDGLDCNQINGGTVGIIISGPQMALGYRDHYQVCFLHNIMWWVGPHEIEPYNY